MGGISITVHCNICDCDCVRNMKAEITSSLGTVSLLFVDTDEVDRVGHNNQ